MRGGFPCTRGFPEKSVLRQTAASREFFAVGNKRREECVYDVDTFAVWNFVFCGIDNVCACLYNHKQQDPYWLREGLILCVGNSL